MVAPLFLRGVKANARLFVIIAAVLTLYITLIIYMYNPEMSALLDSMAGLMPEMMAAVGMTDAGSSLLQFINNYLYGFLLLIFPMVLEIVVANALVSRYIDRGSMAYLLSSRNPRRKLILTQALFLFCCAAAMIVFATLLTIGTSAVFFPGELELPAFLRLNAGLLCLHVCISGICFCASCVCPDVKWAYGVSVGVPVGFYLLNMLANMGGELEVLRYCTIFTLFDAGALMAGSADGLWKSVILLGAGAICGFCGCWGFMRRDIHV